MVWHRTIVALALCSAGAAHAAVDAAGVLLQVTEPSPVLARPDPKAAKLAQADAGTVLLVVEISRKRTWVQVEDEEGTRGWVPVERTDLVELLAAQSKIKKAQAEAIKVQLDTVASGPEDDLDQENSGARFQTTHRLSHVLGPVMQVSDGRAWGMLYSLLFDFQVPGKSGVRQRGVGAEMAWLRASAMNRYEFRLRYTSRFSKRPAFSYGPDAGVRFASNTSPTSFVFGYRLGYHFAWYLPLELRAAVTTESSHRWLGELSWRLRF